jgi:hypothetical protein
MYMTGSPLARAASISDLMYSRATHASSPQEVRQRLIDSRIGSGCSPQNAQLTSMTLPERDRGMPTVEVSERKLREPLIAILRATPPPMRVLSVARDLCLPDWLVFSDAIYQPVLNRLTGRPLDYGIKDYDLGYSPNRNDDFRMGRSLDGKMVENMA